MGFNTASGRYYCNAVVPSDNRKSQKKVSIPQAVGTIAIVSDGIVYIIPYTGSFNTASGRYYCNSRYYFQCIEYIETVSIPQAVGTIAIDARYEQLVPIGCWVSIPQAVGTIAIKDGGDIIEVPYVEVSIPQAVGTIAMELNLKLLLKVYLKRFNTASGRYYCNRKCDILRRRCCRFQYRKR